MTEITFIRETIELAKTNEAISGQFTELMARRATSLHGSITLPKEHPEIALVDFVRRYIEHVPDFIEAISRLTYEAGVFEYAEVFLRVAKDFFLAPPEVIDGQDGLEALMDEAYLAHRLMEEINDRFLMHAGSPLAPLDMTCANVIIHHLIGDNFANELDKSVQFFVEQSLKKERVFKSERFQTYLEKHRKEGWHYETSTWPCLTQDLSVSLTLNSGRTAGLVLKKST